MTKEITWAEVAVEFSNSSMHLVGGNDVEFPRCAAITDANGNIQPVCCFRSPAVALDYIRKVKSGRPL